MSRNVLLDILYKFIPFWLLPSLLQMIHQRFNQFPSLRIRLLQTEQSNDGDCEIEGGAEFIYCRLFRHDIAFHLMGRSGATERKIAAGTSGGWRDWRHAFQTHQVGSGGRYAGSRILEDCFSRRNVSASHKTVSHSLHPLHFVGKTVSVLICMKLFVLGAVECPDAIITFVICQRSTEKTGRSGVLHLNCFV